MTRTMTTTRTPESACSSCGTLNDAATSVDGERGPRPGSVTVCLQCGHIMAFDLDLRLRELTDKEAYAVAGDRRILAIQRGRKKLGIGGKRP